MSLATLEQNEELTIATAVASMIPALTWNGMEVNQKPFGIRYTQEPRGLNFVMRTSRTAAPERRTGQFPQSYSSSATDDHHLLLEDRKFPVLQCPLLYNAFY
jgi:hypothetical protein